MEPVTTPSAADGQAVLAVLRSPRGGDIAVVWCGYDYSWDGGPHHWGTNIVSFMKTGGRWRICGITDNGRSGARPGQ